MEKWRTNSKTLKKIDAFERQCLKELLDKCNEKQVDVFNRMYGSLDKIPKDKIAWAIVQCENTLLKNSMEAVFGNYGTCLECSSTVEMLGTHDHDGVVCRCTNTKCKNHPGEHILPDCEEDPTWFTRNRKEKTT